MNRDLVVSTYEVYFGKRGAAGKAVGVIFYMWHWVPVRNGASFECSVVSTGSPNAVLLGHEMEGERPRSLGASGCNIPQQGVEFSLDYG